MNNIGVVYLLLFMCVIVFFYNFMYFVFMLVINISYFHHLLNLTDILNFIYKTNYAYEQNICNIGLIKNLGLFSNSLYNTYLIP